MGRISKSPEIRRQEILNTAMKLFHEKGYDATSVSDIAKELNVVPGLCYHYFTSKKEIFDVAVKQYAEDMCKRFIFLIKNKNKTLSEKLNDLFSICRKRRWQSIS